MLVILLSIDFIGYFMLIEKYPFKLMFLLFVIIQNNKSHYKIMQFLIKRDKKYDKSLYKMLFIE